MSNLAALYVTLEHYAEAESLYLQAIAIFYHRLGETHPNTQTVLGNFIEFLQQVIQRDRTSELSDHPITRTLREAKLPLLQQLQNEES